MPTVRSPKPNGSWSWLNSRSISFHDAGFRQRKAEERRLMTATRTVLFAVIGVTVISCTASKIAVSSGASTTTSQPTVHAAPEPAPDYPAASTSPPQPATDSRVDFASQIKPFLETDCAPCHFPGGKMYEPLPFDRGETIRLLGADKLFTRVKDEHKRALIRAFLAQPEPA